MKIEYTKEPYFTITRKPFTKDRDILVFGGSSFWQKIKGHLYFLFKFKNK